MGLLQLQLLSRCWQVPCITFRRALTCNSSSRTTLQLLHSWLQHCSSSWRRVAWAHSSSSSRALLLGKQLVVDRACLPLLLLLLLVVTLVPCRGCARCPEHGLLTLLPMLSWLLLLASWD